MVIPNYIKEYMNKIIDNGYECYLVGGAVRDYIIGVDNKDYDFCTNMPFDKLKNILPISIMKENDHRNTGIIRSNEYDLEFSLFRGNNLYEDLSNRDFSINAIATDINGNYIDYFNGMDDIKNKEIRLIKDGGIDNDPLRILRGIRFALKYGFSIDDNTKCKLIEKRSLLGKVAKERILDEFKKIIVFNDAWKYLIQYKEIFFEIIPELKKCDGFNQFNDYHEFDVYIHTVNVFKNVDDNVYLKLAALFYDIGKPDVFNLDDKGCGHFYGHELISLDIFKIFCNKYKVDNKTKKIISDLIKYHDRELSMKNSKIYDFYKKFNMDNIELLFSLKRADILSHNLKYVDRLDDLNELENKYISVRDRYKNINYDGSDIVKLGFSGKIIGIILDDVKRNIICGNLDNDKELIDKYVIKNYMGRYL